MKYWYEIYQIITDELMHRYGLNRDNIGEHIYLLCRKDVDFMKVNSWLEKFQLRPEFQGIDPLHIFASISSSTAGFDTRTERMEGWLNLLQPEMRHELKIDFSGVPAPMSLQLITPRTKEQQDILWKLFVETVSKGTQGLTESLFNNALQCRGVKMPGLSMLLFWINRRHFLPLDSNTEALLKSTGKIKGLPKTHTAYYDC